MTTPCGITTSDTVATETTRPWLSVRQRAMKALTGLFLLACMAPAEAAAQSFLLSSYPGATILLSTTKENGNYLGAAFRVQRASDNTQSDIPFSGKDASVSAFNAFCGGTSCYMVTWYDQSGNGNDCQQATTSRQWQVIIDADGNLSPQSINKAQGCQIAESSSYKTAQPEGFVVLRGETFTTSIDEAVFGYMPTGADNPPASGRDNARFGLGWSAYDYIYVVPVRNADGAYGGTYWTQSRQAYVRAGTSNFTVWDYSSADHQVHIDSGFVVVPSDGTSTNVTYPSVESMMLGNTPSYDGGFQGSIRAFVLYPSTQVNRDAISAYLNSSEAFNNPPIPFVFNLDGFAWNAQFIPTFAMGPVDTNNIAWWNENGGYDWSLSKATTANNSELVRFEVHPYDSDVIVTGAERSERGGGVGGTSSTDITRGGTFEEFAQFLIEPGATQTGDWALTFQIHYNNSSVPDIFFLSLLNDQFQVQTQTNVGANANGPAGYQGTLIPFSRNVWYALRVTGLWSLDGKSDMLQVWLGANGGPLTQIVNAQGTLFATDDTGAYIKQGIYRGFPGANAGNLAIQVANQKFSTTSGTYASYVTAQPPLPSPGAGALSMPMGLTATAASSSQINLSWTDSSVAVIGYAVFRNGTLVGTTSTTSYSDIGLTPATTYSYAIIAFDGAGNVSPASAAVSATTWAAPNSHDFNGDGYSDLAWRDTSGDAVVWLMNSAQVIQSGLVGTAPGWSIVGQRDFNGDGKYDWLWRDGSGNVAIWFLNGTQVAQSAGVGNVPVAWSVLGTGDFNGDGKGDILWQNTSTGDLSIWLMNGAQVTQSAGVGNAPTAVWRIVGIGDFNGDGKSDILWQDVNGNVAIWFMNGTQVTQSAGVGNIPLNLWKIVGTGDFNGDSKSDILWRDTSGNVAIWLMNGAQVAQAAGVGSAPVSVWSIVETGDFNGDGKSDILWQDTTGDVAIWFINGTQVSQAAGVGNIPTAVWSLQNTNAD